MKKIKMARGVTLTFEEGCNKYLENCRQRNLREGTINHYRQSYLYFYKFFNQKHSKDFSGTLEDPDVIKLCGCSRNSYYKYKKAVKESSPMTK